MLDIQEQPAAPHVPPPGDRAALKDVVEEAYRASAEAPAEEPPVEPAEEAIEADEA